MNGVVVYGCGSGLFMNGGLHFRGAVERNERNSLYPSIPMKSTTP